MIGWLMAMVMMMIIDDGWLIDDLCLDIDADGVWWLMVDYDD